MIAFLLALSAGAAESIEDNWRSIDDLEVAGEFVHHLDAPASFTEGALTVDLATGWMVPIWSGRYSGEWEERSKKLLSEETAQGQHKAVLPGPEDRGSREMVGFAFVGDGALTVRLPDRADGLVLADRMVRVLGRDKADFAGVAAGGPFRTKLSEGVILSIDPKFEAIYAGSHSTDPYEIVVYDDAAAAAAIARARELLRQRLDQYDELDIHPGAWIAGDRVAEAKRGGSPQGGHLVADFFTGDRYGLVAQRFDAANAANDQWLGVLRDDSGGLDRRRRSVVASIGRGPEGEVVLGRVSGEVFPPVDPKDPLSAPAPPVRLEAEQADARVYLQPSNSEQTLEVEVQAKLRLRAVGGSIPWTQLDFPRVEAGSGKWELEQATLLDGTSLIGEIPLIELEGTPKPAPEPKPPEPGERPRPEPKPKPLREGNPDDREKSRVTLIFPQPIPAGGEVEIVVRYRDRWPFASWAPCGTVGDRPMGASTGLQRYLPSPAGSFVGGAWAFRTEVAVPHGSRLATAASGHTVREYEQDGWDWTGVAESTSEMWPEVAVGRWFTKVDPAVPGFPAVRVALFDKLPASLGSFAPEVRRVVDYYQHWLPPFPADEVDVFEGPARCGGFVWVAPYGMVNVEQMIIPAGHVGGLDQLVPHLESGAFAHELAHQYWGHLARPANLEDFWISETFAEGYSCMYVGAAFGAETCEARSSKARERWEGGEVHRWDRASLSDAYSSAAEPDIVYEYGPYVLMRMLRSRLGQEVYFAALDVLLRDHPHDRVTTEELESYFERASGKDLSAFFDYWIYAGFIPALSLEYTEEAIPAGARIEGKITSDVPFGTFDVPVDVEGFREVWVTVKDGEGTFTAGPTLAGAKVELDPHGLVMATARNVAKRPSSGTVGH